MIKIVEFSILVEISEGLKKLLFESMYLNLSNGKCHLVSYVSEKKGMFVLRNPSDVPLREVLTCASLNVEIFNLDDDLIIRFVNLQSSCFRLPKTWTSA